MPYFRFEKGFLKCLKSILTFFICESNIKSIFKSYKKSSDTILNFSLQNIHFKRNNNYKISAKSKITIK